MNSDDKIFPAGYLSQRVGGRTAALVGMQQFARTGMVEVSLIGNPDDFGVVQRVEQVRRTVKTEPLVLS